MATISFSGLSSQLDTDSIVQALVDARTAQTITPLENRIVEITDKQAALSTIQAQLGSLLSAAGSLKDATIEGRVATSSDTDKITIDATDSDAVAGSYDVLVNQIATTDKVYFDGAADSDTTTFGTGTVTITSNGVTRTVDIDTSNNTLQGIADAINATSGIEVTASIVNDGTASPYRLVLTSRSTGDAADITHDLETVLTLTSNAATDTLTAANDSQDASITVNSLTITQSTNTFDEAIPGVTFTIRDEETVNPIQINVADDFSATVSAVSSFVSAYNALASLYEEQFSYDESTGSLGVLGSDIGIQNSQTSIDRIILDLYDDLGLSKYTSLSSIGISYDSGSLVLDSAALTAALTDDANEVRTLLQGPSTSSSTEDGLMEKLYDYIDALVDTGTGTLTAKNDSYTTQIDDLNELIAERQDRIDIYEANLEARFVNLELVMSELQTMENTLNSFIDQLYSGNNQ